MLGILMGLITGMFLGGLATYIYIIITDKKEK